MDIGSYRIIRLLGAGGMGKVYEAENANGDRVALKVFSAEHVTSRFLRERFAVEGHILARLSHPRLVLVYESGVDDKTGKPYYAMALIRNREGRSMTLHDVCACEKVTQERAKRWYADLCDVLAYCHRQGVVHRDVKLGNVLLDAEDHAILSDFGVSRIVKSDLREELKVETTFVTGETTGTRPVMGSYWYLAPEIRRGGEATFASDWYALGVLFFRLLTGMWYEPGTNALDLLAPCEPIWRKRLAALLADAPSQRSPLREDEGADGKGRTIRNRWLVAGVLLLAAAGILPFVASNRKSVDNSRLAFAFDGTNTFTFCRCPEGTNRYRKISVAVTHPYWLGATPVTRRQYFAVMGESLSAWEGGEDAPMTYLTRDETTNFCARINQRFAGELPRGYEIRLPTLAEWRLAYSKGNTVPTSFPDKKAMRRACAERGWFGQGVGGESKRANMLRYYTSVNRSVSFVTNIWPMFPPRIINPGKNDWERESSKIPPVPVGLKPANEFGLYDMLGNCFERVYDVCSSNCHHWGKTEWGGGYDWPVCWKRSFVHQSR